MSQQAMAHVKQEPGVQASYAEHGNELLKCNILVVDDSTISREILGACLNGAGYRNLTFAVNGQEAFDRIQESPPDLVILDLEMPVMDGFELLQILRGDESRRNMPVLIQSGRDSPDDLVRAFDCGATDMVVKPVKKFELLARTRVHLEKGQMLRQLLDYQNRVAQELNTARDMQAGICPTPAHIAGMRDGFGVTIDSCFEPCSELGGDIWGLHRIDEKTLGFYIADFSGHGVAAAMNTFRLHSLVSRQPMSATDPAGYLASINSAMHGDLRKGTFATMLVGAIDLRENTLTYASAAAPPPLLLDAKGSRQPEFCPSNGMPIGLRAGSEYRNHVFPFSKDSMLLVYSDALIETPIFGDGALQEDGLMRLVASLQERCHGTDVFTALIDTFERECNAPAQDDLTALCIGGGHD